MVMKHGNLHHIEVGTAYTILRSMKNSELRSLGSVPWIPFSRCTRRNTPFGVAVIDLITHGHFDLVRMRSNESTMTTFEVTKVQDRADNQDKRLPTDDTDGNEFKSSTSGYWYMYMYIARVGLKRSE